MPEHATARRTAPVHPRRVSGPSRRLAPAGAPLPRGRTGAFERLSRIPDHHVVDRLLRGRACIWVIGMLLGGIVAMQVSLLRLNSGITRAVQTQETLERQNATLQAAIAELTSGERIAAAATSLNMVDPPAGETRYLTARPDRDPRYAAERMKPPSERAKAIMANGGMLPGALAEPGSAAAALGRVAQRHHGNRHGHGGRRRSGRHRCGDRQRVRGRHGPGRRYCARGGHRAGDHEHRPRAHGDPGRHGRTRGDHRPSGDGAAGLAVQLVERRIGLLFAVFLVALGVGAFKAAWLGVVKAGTLQHAAASQQEADDRDPRASRVDRRRQRHRPRGV